MQQWQWKGKLLCRRRWLQDDDEGTKRKMKEEEGRRLRRQRKRGTGDWDEALRRRRRRRRGEEDDGETRTCWPEEEGKKEFQERRKRTRFHYFHYTRTTGLRTDAPGLAFWEEEGGGGEQVVGEGKDKRASAAVSLFPLSLFGRRIGVEPKGVARLEMLLLFLGSSVARVFARYNNIAVVLHRSVLVFFLLLCRTGRTIRNLHPSFSSVVKLIAVMMIRYRLFRCCQC